MFIREKGVAALLGMVAWLTPVAAGEYTDPSGFSLVYPDGWLAVPNTFKGAKPIQLPPEDQKWLKKNNLNLDQVSVTVVRKAREDFLENLNVVVERQQLPVNDETAKKLLNMVVDKYRSMGATIDSPEARVRKLGSDEVIVLNYGSKLPIAAFKLRQRQVFIPAGGKTYIVTCTAKADSFARYAQTFESMLASFKVPAPAARSPFGQGFDWMPVLMGAIVGGAVGGLVVLFKMLAARR